MSIWTHINGSIRVDTYDWKEHKFRETSLSYVLSKFYDDWKFRTPRGTEGPLTLQHSFTLIAPNQSMITLSFSGNLRDYDKEDVKYGLIPWVKNIAKEQSIRQGFVQIEVEPNLYIDMIYKNNEWQIKESIEE